MDSGASEVDEEMTMHLLEALKKYNLEGWSFVPEEGGGPPGCVKGQACVTVKTIRTGVTFSVVLLSSGEEVMASRTVKFKQDEDPSDVAQALALKIVYLLEKIKPGSGNEAKKAGASKAKGKAGVKAAGGPKDAEPHDEAGGEDEAKAAGDEEPGPGTESSETGPEGSPGREPAEEKAPPPREKEADGNAGKAPGSEKSLQPAAEKKKKRKIFHLGVSIAYMTGFTEHFNTGGLELGGAVMLYGPMALRLDVGFHPVGGSSDEEASVRYYTLPIDVMAGYFNNFGRFHLGVYGGLNMMALWVNYQASGMGNASDFMIGAALLAEAAYVVNRTVSIGVFLRFVYTSDDIEVYEDDDNDPPGEDTEIFTLPKFLLTCGVSLLISF